MFLRSMSGLRYKNHGDIGVDEPGTIERPSSSYPSRLVEAISSDRRYKTLLFSWNPPPPFPSRLVTKSCGLESNSLNIKGRGNLENVKQQAPSRWILKMIVQEIPKIKQNKKGILLHEDILL
jgi:hypothetical protein